MKVNILVEKMPEQKVQEGDFILYNGSSCPHIVTSRKVNGLSGLRGIALDGITWTSDPEGAVKRNEATLLKKEEYELVVVKKAVAEKTITRFDNIDAPKTRIAKAGDLVFYASEPNNPHVLTKQIIANTARTSKSDGELDSLSFNGYNWGCNLVDYIKRTDPKHIALLNQDEYEVVLRRKVGK